MVRACWLIFVLVHLRKSSYAIDDTEGCEPINSGRYHVMKIWEVGVKTFEMYGVAGLTESPIFSIWSNSVEEKWYLRLFPAGVKDSSPGHFSLYLISQNNFTTSPEVELSIINREKLDYIRKNIVHTFKSYNEMSGWTDFTKTSSILDPSQGFVFDEKIKIGIRFATEQSHLKPPEPMATFYWPVRLDKMKLEPTVSSESPKFITWDEDVNELTWNLRLYPGGSNAASENATSESILTSLYLVFVGTAPFTTKVEFMVKNVRPENSILSRTDITYTRHGESSGLLKLAHRDHIMNPDNGFVNDGEILFGARIPVLNMRQYTLTKGLVTGTWEIGVLSFRMNNTGSDELAMESPKTIVWNGRKQEGWHLRMFVNGYQAENEGFVSLYLVYDGTHSTTPYADIFAINKDPRNNLRKWSSDRYDRPNQSQGWHRFISKEMLLNPENGFVNDGKVKFGFRVPTDLALPPSERPVTTRIWEIGLKTILSGTKQLESPRYKVRTVNGTDTWYFRAYPQGYKDDVGFLSLYLVYGNRNSTSSPRGEVLMLNKQEENTIRKWSFGDYASFGQSIGWPRFARSKDVTDEAKGFVFGNKIRIALRIPEDLDGIYKQTCPICSDTPTCEPPAVTTPEPCPTLPPVTTPPKPPAGSTSPNPPSSVLQPPLPKPGQPTIPHGSENTVTSSQKNSLTTTTLTNVVIKRGNDVISAGEITTSAKLNEILDIYSQKAISTKDGTGGSIEIILPTN